MQVTMSKNFYLAGEMAYLAVNIDNSQSSNPCSLIISQKLQAHIYLNNCKYKWAKTQRKERFFLANAGEQKQFVLQFRIESKRKSAKSPGYFKHAKDYHHVNTLIPESIHAQTFSILNYLELYLTHDNIMMSDGSTKKFYFQLIQHSLVPEVVEPAPPIFLDING